MTKIVRRALTAHNFLPGAARPVPSGAPSEAGAGTAAGRFRAAVLALLIAAAPLPACAENSAPGVPDAASSPEALPASALLDYECLREAYPGFFKSMERGEDGCIRLVTSAGESLLYDDGREKTFDEMMNDADIEDTLRMPYPLEPSRPVPAKDFDPGRVRSYPLLKALYGADRKAAERGSTAASLGGRRLRVAGRIAGPLARVDREYMRLFAENPKLRPYLQGDVDCMCWRVIARTNLLSAHSWGTAIDLNPKMGTYWQWSKKMPHPQQFSFPAELVRPFEENGFIWGGKWQHYDMMHFEYRPEIIIKAKKLQERRR